MPEERFWNIDESISTAKFAVHDGAVTMRQAGRIFRLNPAPPKVEDINDYIVSTVREKWSNLLYSLSLSLRVQAERYRVSIPAAWRCGLRGCTMNRAKTERKQSEHSPPKRIALSKLLRRVYIPLCPVQTTAFDAVVCTFTWIDILPFKQGVNSLPQLKKVVPSGAQSLFDHSRRKRYNTLDFPKESRVPKAGAPPCGIYPVFRMAEGMWMHADDMPSRKTKPRKHKSFLGWERMKKDIHYLSPFSSMYRVSPNLRSCFPRITTSGGKVLPPLCWCYTQQIH